MRLDAENQGLLEEVIRARAGDIPELQGISVRRDLTDSEVAILCHLLTQEFIASGLGPGDEPNDRGLRIEKILDDLNRQRIGTGKP